MLDAALNAPPIAGLLAVLGLAGAIVGGVVGWFIEATNWRRAFENLALGATAGTVCFSAAAFLSYALIRVFGW
jgi:VIT1/CCC1 family predicted Fe2+/Mn2+ transporter